MNSSRGRDDGPARSDNSTEADEQIRQPVCRSDNLFDANFEGSGYCVAITARSVPRAARAPREPASRRPTPVARVRSRQAETPSATPTAVPAGPPIAATVRRVRAKT
jgi:hypothetical protein